METSSDSAETVRRLHGDYAPIATWCVEHVRARTYLPTFRWLGSFSGALEKLLAYNREDTVHLERLLELVVERWEAGVFRSVVDGED